MRTHILTRYVGLPHCTIGEIEFGHDKYYSMERPWKDNKPFHSCIPLGTYTLEAHNSTSHPHTFALVNHELGVYHYEDPKAKRYGILMHKGNFSRNFEGCVGFGNRIGCLSNEWAIMRTEDSTAEVVSHMAEGDIFQIVEKKVQW